MSDTDQATDKQTVLEIKVGVPADPDDTTRFISVGYAGHPRPPVFTTATKYALLLAQDASVFRDPRIMRTPIALIETITLRGGRPERDDQLIRFESGQQPTLRTTIGVDSPTTIQLDSKRSTAMLQALAQARASSFVAGPFDALAYIQHIAVQPRLGGEEEFFTVFADPESTDEQATVLIQRSDEPVALRVPRAAVAGLLGPLSLVAEDSEDND